MTPDRSPAPGCSCTPTRHGDADLLTAAAAALHATPDLAAAAAAADRVACDAGDPRCRCACFTAGWADGEWHAMRRFDQAAHALRHTVACTCHTCTAARRAGLPAPADLNLTPTPPQ